MRTRQVAVPVLAAMLGSAITAGAMVAGGGTDGPFSRQQGVLASADERLTTNEIYDRAAPGVVHVRASTVQAGVSAFEAPAGGELAVANGSGFVLDDEGRVITSAHVISGVTAVQVTFADDVTAEAHVLGKDEATDVAVLAVNPDGLDLHPLELGDSNVVRPGDQVVAVGNPTGDQPTAGTGRIAAAGQRVEVPGGYLIDDVFATDAVIAPASSGGPLMGPDGRVIGLTSRIDGETGFAVPADTIRDVITEIEQTGKVIRPYIGLRASDADGTVRVTEVFPDGPAARAGVQVGDTIEAIDGKPCARFADVLVEVDRHAPGDTVQLTLARNGARGDVSLQLDERPATLPTAGK